MRKRAQRKHRRKKINKKKLGIFVIILLIIAIILIFVDWEEEDYREIYLSQLPDLDSTGMGLCMKGDIPYTSFADDFFWNESSPVTEITLWGSYRNDALPEDGVDSLAFQIIIHENDNNKPGSSLWKETFNPGEYLVKLYEESRQGWYCYWSNYFERNNLKKTYQYDFFIEGGINFFQNNTEIYWLEVRWIHEDIDYNFGWKTTIDEDRWKENAYISDGSNWTPLKYPSGHEYNNQKINLAFAIR